MPCELGHRLFFVVGSTMSSTWTLRSMTRPTSETFSDWFTLSRIVIAISLPLLVAGTIIVGKNPFCPPGIESLADVSPLSLEFWQRVLQPWHCKEFLDFTTKAGRAILETEHRSKFH